MCVLHIHSSERDIGKELPPVNAVMLQAPACVSCDTITTSSRVKEAVRDSQNIQRKQKRFLRGKSFTINNMNQETGALH